MKHSCLDRIDRAIGDCRGLLVSQAQVEDENDGPLLCGRQCVQSLPYPILDFPGGVVVGPTVVDIGQSRDLQLLPGHAAHRLFVRDAKNPGRYLRLSAKRAGLVPYDEHDVIYKFIGRSIRPRQAEHELEQTCVIIKVQPGEGTPVTRCDQSQERKLLFVLGIDPLAWLICHICSGNDVLILESVKLPTTRTLVPLKQ